MAPNATTMGQRMKAAREAEGISQRDAAFWLGIEQGTLSKTENDLQAPSHWVVVDSIPLYNIARRKVPAYIGLTGRG